MFSTSNYKPYSKEEFNQDNVGMKVSLIVNLDGLEDLCKIPHTSIQKYLPLIVDNSKTKKTIVDTSHMKRTISPLDFAMAIGANLMTLEGYIAEVKEDYLLISKKPLNAQGLE